MAAGQTLALANQSGLGSMYLSPLEVHTEAFCLYLQGTRISMMEDRRRHCLSQVEIHRSTGPCSRGTAKVLSSTVCMYCLAVGFFLVGWADQDGR